MNNSECLCNQCDNCGSVRLVTKNLHNSSCTIQYCKNCGVLNDYPNKIMKSSIEMNDDGIMNCKICNSTDFSLINMLRNTIYKCDQCNECYVCNTFEKKCIEEKFEEKCKDRLKSCKASDEEKSDLKKYIKNWEDSELIKTTLNEVSLNDECISGNSGEIKLEGKVDVKDITLLIAYVNVDKTKDVMKQMAFYKKIISEQIEELNIRALFIPTSGETRIERFF